MKTTLVALISVMLCASAFGQQSSSIFKLAWQKSLDGAVKAYPDLSDQNSLMWQMSHELAVEARNAGNRNHALLSSPNAPRLFADLAAKQIAAAADQAHEKSLEECGAVYPDLTNSNSLMWRTAHRLAEEAADPNNVNHALLSDPDSPMLFADLAAKEIGVAPRNAANAQQPPAGNQAQGPQFVVAMQDVKNAKTTLRGGWNVEIGEIFPFVRYMSSREFAGGAADNSDQAYVVLKMDEGVVIVPAGAVSVVAQKDAAGAAVRYNDEVRQKRQDEADAAGVPY